MRSCSFVLLLLLVASATPHAEAQQKDKIAESTSSDRHNTSEAMHRFQLGAKTVVVPPPSGFVVAPDTVGEGRRDFETFLKRVDQPDYCGEQMI